MPAGNIESRSTYGGLIKGVEAAFIDVFDQTLLDYKPMYERIAKKRGSTKERERTTGVAGPGNLILKDEGDNVSRGARLKLYNTEYIHKTYAKAIEVTMEAMEDNEWSEKLDDAKMLTRRGVLTMEQHFFQLFNDGFSLTDSDANFPISRYGDGKALFSTAHPRKDGGTAQSNASATSIALSEANLNVGRLALLRQLQDDGTPMDTTGKILLIVSLANEKLAVEITKSEYRSGTANNDINFYEGVGFDVLACKYLDSVLGGSDTAWFLVMPEIAKLLMWERKGLTMRNTTDEDTFNFKSSIHARWSVGFGDWRGTWGSKGDGTVYSG